MPHSDLIRIGRIVATFGLKGGLKVQLAGDFGECLAPGNTVVIGGGVRTIEDVGWHKSQARIWLEGIRRIEDAERLIGADVEVAQVWLPVPEEDAYLVSDLLGLQVYDEEGRSLGTVDEVLKRPANDVYRVGKAMIPAVKEFVLTIDLEARRMTVRLLPGMEDLA